MGMKMKKILPITCYNRDRCKRSREFIMHQYGLNMSLRICERLKQAGIETM